MSTRPEHEIQIGQFIVNCEARRNKKKQIQVYILPPADGGGTFEVAGINDKYHRKTAYHLRSLIEAGKFEEAENGAREHILAYTDVVVGWCPESPAVQAYLRDCAFNRGPGGAGKILQRAVGGVKVDGAVGPITKAAVKTFLARYTPADLLLQLRAAREAYEKKIAPPVGDRAQFWKGLVNRWNKSLVFAQTLL